MNIIYCKKFVYLIALCVLLLLLLLSNFIMTHKCNREDCPSAHVNGPTIKCAKCKSICYLKCFGIEKCATWESVDVIKYTLPNGSALYTFLPHSAFVCCGENITSPELKANLKVPGKQRGTSQTRIQTKTSAENASILNEIAEIKQKLNAINDSTEKNSTELDNIKIIVNENNVFPHASVQ